MPGAKMGPIGNNHRAQNFARDGRAPSNSDQLQLITGDSRLSDERLCRTVNS